MTPKSEMSLFDKYALWAIQSFRGGGLLVPPLVIFVVPFVLLDPGPDARSPIFSFFFFVGIGLAILSWVVIFLRGAKFMGEKFRRKRHLEAFWNRKLKAKKNG